MPLHIQVSSCSPKALQLVEAAGGSVERVYYTRLGLKALLKVGSGQHHRWLVYLPDPTSSLNCKQLLW